MVIDAAIDANLDIFDDVFDWSLQLTKNPIAPSPKQVIRDNLVKQLIGNIIKSAPEESKGPGMSTDEADIYERAKSFRFADYGDVKQIIY